MARAHESRLASTLVLLHHAQVFLFVAAIVLTDAASCSCPAIDGCISKRLRQSSSYRVVLS
jgi:hypothetical protein